MRKTKMKFTMLSIKLITVITLIQEALQKQAELQ